MSVSVSTLEPTPIAERLSHLSHLLTTLLSDKNISRKDPGNPLFLSLTSYSTTLLHHKKDLTRATLQLNLSEGSTCLNLPPSLTRRTDTITGPAQPKAQLPTLAHTALSENTALSLQAHSHKWPQNLLALCPSPLFLPLMGHTFNHVLDKLIPLPSSSPRLLPSLPFSSDVTRADVVDFEHEHDTSDPYSSCHIASQTGPNTKDHTTAPLFIRTENSHMPLMATPLSEITQKTKKSKKGNKMATRRSPRLQAKTRTISPANKNTPKEKISTAKISFDLDQQDTPIDASTTLTILQASGLKIDEQLQQMVQEAAHQDRADATQEEAIPTTLLHDQIPPYAVPGTDHLL